MSPQLAQLGWYIKTNWQTRVQKRIVDILLRKLYRSLKVVGDHIWCELLITVLAMFIRTSSHCFLVQMSSCCLKQCEAGEGEESMASNLKSDQGPTVCAAINLFHEVWIPILLQIVCSFISISTSLSPLPSFLPIPPSLPLSSPSLSLRLFSFLSSSVTPKALICLHLYP